MNITLYIENNLIELSERVEFALNRVYEELYNPTIINNDYSKTIKIPFTTNNNRIFGDIYNIEREYIDGTGMGMYFNPSNKADFTLYFNSGVLMTGYVKLNSVNTVEQVYEINLFGELGNTFTDLKQCTFSTNIIDDSDDGIKYVIPNPLSDSLELTKELVKESWERDTPILDIHDENITDTDIIGFAPVEQGIPKNFKGDTWLNRLGEFETFGNLLNSRHNIDYGGTIIGDGLTERQFGQYRVQYQKPYIYVNKLWQIMVDKSKEICEYPLHLDDIWFNKYNPYYRDLIYLCNDLSDGQDIEEDTNLETVIKLPTDGTFGYQYKATSDKYYSVDRLRFTIESNSVYGNLPESRGYDISPSVYLDIVVESMDGNFSKHFAVISKFNKLDYPPYTPDDGVETVYAYQYYNGNTFVLSFHIDANKSFLGDRFKVRYEWKYKPFTPTPDERRNPYHYQFISYVIGYGGIPQSGGARLFGANSYISIDDSATYTSSIVLSMARIWNPDIKPFDILLNYSKMFGLVFQVDYDNKWINVTCRNEYFKNYKIVDWTDKVNTLNINKIEQPTFESKYVVFNFDDVDGDRYKAYQDKYQLGYGAKRIITDYNFNTDEEKLFDGIKPCNVINEELYTWTQLYGEWVPGSMIPKVVSTEVLFDNLKDGSSANINSCFLFRCDNQNTDSRLRQVYITENTPTEVNNDTYCYISTDTGTPYLRYFVAMNIMPKLSFIDRSGEYSCLFTEPKELYVDKSLLSDLKEQKNIYDTFWRDYINERYSVRNKNGLFK